MLTDLPPLWYLQMNDLLRPAGMPFDSPEISPVMAEDVSGLPYVFFLFALSRNRHTFWSLH